jgi:antitoxin component YwqK of YwqJK toxin-antitoxin module
MKRTLTALACLIQIFWLSSQIDLPDGFQTIVNQDNIRTSAGEIKGGLPQGLWINFYLNQTLKSKGFWSDGKLDSTWKFYASDGKLEKLICYKNDLKNGKYQVFDSLEHLHFEGWYINDALQGPFKTFTNGALQMSGNFTDGLKTGIIEEFDTLGNLRSVIELENGKVIGKRNIQTLVNGKSKQSLDSNSIKINFTESNEKINRLEFKDEYGVILSEAVLVNGKKEGFEIFYNNQQTIIFAKEWQQDTLVAEGKMDKNWYKDSVWTTYSNKAYIISRVSYKDGYKQGKCTYYFNSGIIEQEGDFQNNELNGLWRWYYEDGSIRKEERYYRNMQDGEQIDYNRKGDLVQTKTYLFQSMEGSTFYYYGDHQEKGNYRNGIRQGKWIYRFSNGKKEFIGKYKDGLAQGKHKYWYDNGRKKRIEKYKNGVLHGRRTDFSKNGGVEDQFYFKHGKLVLVNGFFVKNRILIQK